MKNSHNIILSKDEAIHVKSSTSLDKYIGLRIRQIREAAGVSSFELSHELKITQQQMTKYERGENRIPASRLYEIADFMKLPVETFFPMNLANKSDNSNHAQNMFLKHALEHLKKSGVDSYQFLTQFDALCVFLGVEAE